MKSLLLLAFTLLAPTLFAQPTVTVQQYVTGFTSPVDIANCGDDRLFIVEQTGYIRIIDGQGNKLPQAFMDINTRVRTSGEEGLLGLAFHPDYLNNGYFFVYYTNNGGDQVISRFSVSGDPNVADTSSETPVITILHPGQSNHNGGNLEFGPDGYLYIATGDGGGSGDPGDNAQDPLELLGKMLRLDVDTLPYLFPPDNPYFGFASVRNEIWVRGLRNPWRFSFDRVTGDLWIGDVGQNKREEIDFQPSNSLGGENYGWKCYEGDTTFGTSGFGCNHTFTFPVHAYKNPSLGRAVTGGYVYRGCKYPNLYGYYVFADAVSDRVWTLHNNGGTWVATEHLNDNARNYSTFGEDRYGELYVAGVGNGVVYKVVDSSPAAIIAGGSTSLCPGGSVLFSAPAGFDSYDWFRNGNSVATGTHQFMAQDSGNYTVVLSRNNNCSYTTPAVAVTIYPLSATPVITASANSYCSGDSVQLSTGAYSSYLWSDGATTQTNFVQQGNYSVSVTDANGCPATSGSSVTITENPLPQPVIQQTGALCGTASSVALSTTASFSAYAWSSSETTPVATITQPGDYDVTVTDANGCEGVSPQFTVALQTALTPSLISQNGENLCAGESTELSLAESFSSYLWSTGATGATITVNTTGDYWVAVSDTFGCAGNSDTLEIIVHPNPAPTVASSNGNPICSGTSTTLSVLENYQAYVWSTGQTTPTFLVSLTGEYWIEVTDSNGCKGADTIFISVLPSPNPTIAQGAGVVQCGDGVVELFTDTAYANYMWSDGGTSDTLFVTESGTFNVTVELSNGCTGVSDSVVVEIYPANQDTPVILVTGYATLMSQETAYGYQWYYDPVNSQNPVLMPDDTTREIIAGFSTGNGWYYLALVDSNGCRSPLSESVYVQVEGIEETWLGSISLQPNPFTNEIILDYTLKDLVNVRISLKDLTGKEIALLLDEKKGAGSYKLAINTGQYGLSQGLYLLEIANGKTRKVLKVEKM